VRTPRSLKVVTGLAPARDPGGRASWADDDRHDDARATHPWFGFHLPNYSHPGTPPEHLFDRVIAEAQAAEQAGFSLVTVMDHLYQIAMAGPPSEPMLEAWTTLAALARETRAVRLGTLVTGVTYRNPAYLAKLATTLDTISGGRAILGLGAAWNEDEHRGYGFDFPPLAERMDRLDEALTIIGDVRRDAADLRHTIDREVEQLADQPGACVLVWRWRRNPGSRPATPTDSLVPARARTPGGRPPRRLLPRSARSGDHRADVGCSGHRDARRRSRTRDPGNDAPDVDRTWPPVARADGRCCGRT
jgi:alkanesulfonate monooxygenase SsuD/methylene tetrahydromethanopterin reductase-like flavin-dependent oxidoreductase (luciferase family)